MMKPFRSLLMFLPLLAAFPLLAQQAIPLDGYVAAVNDRVITLGDLMPLLMPVEQQLRMTYRGEELGHKLQEAYGRARDSLVERELILEEFKTIEGAALPDKVVDAQIEQVIRERFQGDRGSFFEALSQDRLTLGDYRERTRENMIVSLLRRENVGAKVVDAPGAARRLYEQRLEEYRQPAMAKVRMVVIQQGETEEDAAVKRQQAEVLREKLVQGADFAEIAREFSEGGKADRGGDWGWVEPNSFREELAQAVHETPVGTVSKMVEAGSSFYLILVEARRESGATPFEDVRGELEREVRAQEEQRLYSDWMSRLRAKHYVQVYEMPGMR